jgi:predicted nucleic acid-binding protein
MKIIVDTCVWSLALRRKEMLQDPYIVETQELIKELRIQMIGPIRQEILSGIASKQQFDKLRKHLRAFPDLALDDKDYERAAEMFNLNRSVTIQVSLRSLGFRYKSFITYHPERILCSRKFNNI